jgi:hypothetical protein
MRWTHNSRDSVVARQTWQVPCSIRSPECVYLNLDVDFHRLFCYINQMKDRIVENPSTTHYSRYTRPMLAKADKGWRPSNKEEVVDLLMEVQIGYISCRRAADILFPEYK